MNTAKISSAARAGRRQRNLLRRQLRIESLERRELLAVVSYWSADNTASDSISGNNGSLYNGATYSAGQVGEAFSFDGVDDGGTVRDSASFQLTESLSIEVWIKVNGLPSGPNDLGMILLRGDDRDALDPYQLRVEPNGEITFQISSLTGSARLSAPIATSQFVHVAAVLDDTTGNMQLYQNGALVTQVVTNVRPFADLDPTMNPAVGIGNHGGYPRTPHNFPFNGQIDELKLYDHALSAAEVQANFNASKGSSVISVSAASAIEGSSVLKVLDRFVNMNTNGLQRPRTPLFGPDGNGDGLQDLYVTSSDTNQVLRFDGKSGAAIDVFVEAGAGGLLNPADLAFGPDGSLYVSSFGYPNGTPAVAGAGSVLRYDGTTGTFLEIVASGFTTPLGIVVAADGTLFTASQGTNEIYRTLGGVTSVFVSAGSGGLERPRNVLIGPDVTGDGAADIYVSNPGSVLRYNGVTGAFIDNFASVELGSGPAWIDFAPDGDLVASGQTTSTCCERSYVRFNGTTGAKIDQLDTNIEGWSFKYGPDGLIFKSGNSHNFVDRIGPSSLLAFTVSLSYASEVPVNVSYSTANGTAVAGADYQEASGTLTFAPGQTTRTILIPTFDDANNEGNESMFVNLSNPVGATIMNSQAEGTIFDDDASVTISYLDFSDTTNLNLIADVSAPHGPNNSLLLTPQQPRYHGGAWHNVPQVVAASFETEFEFKVDAGGAEGSDGFAFVIQNDSAGAFGGLGGGNGYTGVPNSLAIEFDTFQNVEDPDNNHVAIHSNGVERNSRDLNAILAIAAPTFNINDGQQHHVRVSYVPGLLSVYLDHGSEPTVTANVDFAGLLNLNAGRAWLGFTGISGGTGQSQEILNWTFSSSGDTSTSISISDAQLVEGDSGSSNMLFTVTRAGDLSNASFASWTTLDGSATTGGNDYTSNSGQLEFAAGEAVKTIHITVNGDTDEELHEQFFVRITDATGAFIGDSLASGMVLNDDLTVSIAGADAQEGGQHMAFLGEFAKASEPPLLSSARGMVFGPDGNLYVARGYREVVRFDGETGAPLGVFAAAEELAGTRDIAFGPDGNLYVTDNVQSRVVRFNGTTGEFIDVFVTSRAGGLHTARGLAFGPDGDLYVASGESHEIMQYNGASGSYVRTFVTAGSGGLNAPQALTFHDGYLYASSGPNQTASILRYDASSGEFVDAFVPAGSAGLTVVVSGGLTFGPDVNGDGKSDLWASSGLSDEVLVFDGATGEYLQTAASPASGGLDGPAGLAFDPDNNLYVVGTQNRSILRYGLESQAAFTVSLSSPSGVQVTVDFTSVNNTAIAGSDFVATSGTLVFEPGVTSRTIIVKTIDDTVYEDTESFFVNLSNPVGATIVDSQGVGTIIDNDSDSTPPTVSQVFASSSAWSTALIDRIGNGNGLGIEVASGGAPLPWAGIDRLYLQFSEAIQPLTAAMFELRDSVGTLPFSLDYDPVNWLVTLSLPAGLPFSKLRLAAAESIVDLAGNALDGGVFDFRFDVLPGDANGDGRVNGADLTPFGASFNAQVNSPTFNPRANWNGDDRVNGTDLTIFSSMFNQRVETLSEPGAPFGSGGGASRFSRTGHDSFFNSFAEDDEDEEYEQDEELRGRFRPANLARVGDLRDRVR